jgi:hypothetical protein
MGNFPTLLEYGSGGDVLEDEMFVKWAVIGGKNCAEVFEGSARAIACCFRRPRRKLGRNLLTTA